MKIKRTISRGAFAILAAMLLMLVPAPPSSTIAAEDDVIFTIDNIRLNKGGAEIAQPEDGAVAVSADVTNHSEESYTPLLMAFACIGQEGAEDTDRFIIHDTDDNAATTFAAGESKRITFNVTVKDAANSFIKIVVAESLSSGKLLSEQTYYDPTWAVKLQSLTVAGKALEDFNPDEMQRTIKLDKNVTFPLEIEATAAFSGAAVKVSSPASIEDTLTVEVSCGTLPVSTYVFDLMWQPRVEFTNYRTEGTVPTASEITVVDDFQGGQRWNNNGIAWEQDSIPDYLKGTTYIRTNYLDNPSNSPDLNANIDNKLFTMTLTQSATVYLATWSTYVSGSCQRFVAGWENAGAQWMNGKQPVSLTTSDSRNQWKTVYLLKREIKVPEGGSVSLDFTVPGSSYNISMYSMFIDWGDKTEPTPTPTVTPTPTPDSGKGTVTFTNYRTEGTVPAENEMTVVENFSGGLRWNNRSDVSWKEDTIPEYLKGTTYIRTNYLDNPSDSPDLNADGSKRLFTMTLDKSATVYYVTWSTYAANSCQRMVNEWVSKGAEWLNNKEPVSFTTNGSGDQKTKVYLLKRTFEVPEGETLDIDFLVPAGGYSVSMYSMFIDWADETEPTPTPTVTPTPTPDSGKGTVTFKDYAQEAKYPAADNITVVENFSGGLRWNNRSDISWKEDTIPDYLKGTTYIRTNYGDNPSDSPDLNANIDNKLFTMTINKSATVYLVTWSTYVSSSCQRFVARWESAGAEWMNGKQPVSLTTNGSGDQKARCYLVKRTFEVPEGETLDIDFTVAGSNYSVSMYSMFIDWADEAAANEPETQSLFRASLGMPVYAAETGNADYTIKNGTAYVTGQGAGGRKILVEVFKPDTNAAERTPDDLLYYHVVPADETGGFEAAVPLGMADTTGKFPYTIYTQNETIFTKTETIDYDPSGDSSITVFSLGGKTGTIDGNNISVTVDANTNVTGMIATFTAGRNAEVTVNGAVQISGQTRNNFTNPVVYTVTADDGTQTQYTVTVTKSGGVSGGGMSGGGGGTSGSRGTGGTSYTEVPNFSANQTIPNRNGVQLFADVDGSHWAYDYIDCLLAKKIVSGYEDGAFRPDSNITREEFVKIAVEAFAIVSDSSGAAFEDVQSGAWYEYYVQTAAGAGIVNGIDETHFGTGEMVTRQDLAVMIARVIEAENISIKAIENAPTFTDEADISGYAQEAVKKLAAAGILGGYADGSFNPNGIATRAEVCAILYRMINGR
ncbi:MAG: S-layer homology domain-containing protein [Clostridia bacterium]|nr:S-layer homology domain-containing protein [Clostridia bacterium]